MGANILAVMGSYMYRWDPLLLMRPMKDTMRKALPLAGTALVLAACLLAAGCTGQAPGGNETVPAIDLDGTTWDLVSYAQNGSMVNALEGTPVTLVFGENKTAGGSAGCNHYSASYTVNGKAITFGPAGSTLMYCMKPGVMDQESAYLGLLGTVKTYEFRDGALTFFDGNGTAVLEFKKHVPPTPEPLVGTDWTLASYHTGDAIVSVIAGTTVTAVFTEDGFGGSAGCNHYFGTYTVDGAKMTVGALGFTEMYCENPGVMDQESTYLGLLGSVASFAIEGEELTLMDANGTKVLMFVKAVPPEPEPLVGTNWTLESLHTGDAVSSVIAGSGITAVFGDDGKVTGSAGCNNYFASYNLSGSSLTFGPAGSTKMSCAEPEGVMEQESTYLGLLEAMKSYTIEGDRLSLLDENGTAVLDFRAKA